MLFYTLISLSQTVVSLLRSEVEPYVLCLVPCLELVPNICLMVVTVMVEVSSRPDVKIFLGRALRS